LPNRQTHLPFKTFRRSTMSRLSNSLVAIAALLALSTVAQAQSIRVKCEKRADRSTASIDGTNLIPGTYSSVLTSGPNTAQAPARATVGDEVGFDFSSQQRDIRRGATPLSTTFITGGQATGTLLDANGQVVATQTARCRVR
jgi:hypothetical protein